MRTMLEVGLLVLATLASLGGFCWLCVIAIGVMDADGQTVAITALPTVIGLLVTSAVWTRVIMAAYRIERDCSGL